MTGNINLPIPNHPNKDSTSKLRLFAKKAKFLTSVIIPICFAAPMLSANAANSDLPVLGATGPEEVYENEDYLIIRLNSDRVLAYELTVNLTLEQTGNFIGRNWGGKTPVIAGGGASYLRFPGTFQVKLYSGWQSTSIVVFLLDNNEVEPDGSIAINLQSGNGYEVAEDGTATAEVRVINDDKLPETQNPPPVLGFSEVSDEFRTESAYPVKLFLTTDRKLTHHVQINLNVRDTGDFLGVAPGQGRTLDRFPVADPYNSKPELRVFSDNLGYVYSTGSTTVTWYHIIARPYILLVFEEDNIDEPNGSITVEIAEGWGYVVANNGTASRTIKIHDNDDIDELAVQIISTSDEIIEGEPATFRLLTSIQPKNNLRVDFRIIDGFNFLSESVDAHGSVVILGHQGKNFADLSVPTSQDNVDEEHGRIAVELQPGQGYTVANARSIASVSVIPEIMIASVAKVPIMEGALARFTFTAIGAVSERDLTFRIHISQVGSFADLPASSGCLPRRANTPCIPYWNVILKSGETSVNLEIPTDDDNNNEESGSITVHVLLSDRHYRPHMVKTATIVIEDNDEEEDTSMQNTVEETVPSSGTGINVLPEILIASVSKVPITEGAPARFTLTAIGEVAEHDLKVGVTSFQVGNFVSLRAPRLVILESGETSANLEIPTVDDNIVEENGSITVQVMNGQHYRPHTTHSATIVIEDNDKEGNTSTQYAVAGTVAKHILSKLSSVGTSPVQESSDITSIVSVTPVSSSVWKGEPALFKISVRPELKITTIVKLSVTGSAGMLTETPVDSIILMAGVNETTLEFQTKGDKTPEPNGFVAVSIEPGNGYRINSDNNTANYVADSPSRASVTVLDYDFLEENQGMSIADVIDSIQPRMLDLAMTGTHKTLTSRRNQTLDRTPDDNSFSLGGKTNLTEMLTYGGDLINDGLILSSVLKDSSFLMSLTSDAGADGSVSVWGIGDVSELISGDINGFNWNSDITEAHAGIDSLIGQALLIGIASSYSETHTEYENTRSMFTSGGGYNWQTAGIHPYIGWASLDDTTSFGGSLGYGQGSITIDQDGFGAETADTEFVMTSLWGDRLLYGEVLDSTDHGTEIRLVSEAWTARQHVEQNNGLIGDTQLDDYRVALATKGSRKITLDNGSEIALSPSVGLGWNGGLQRHRTGLEIGGDAAYLHPIGLELWSYGHFAQTDWGVKGGLEYNKDIQLSVNSEWGQLNDNLFASQREFEKFDFTQSNSVNNSDSRHRIEIGYGIDIAGNGGFLTPYAGLNLHKGNGYTIQWGSRYATNAGLGIELNTRRTLSDAGNVRYKLNLSGNINW